MNIQFDIVKSGLSSFAKVRLVLLSALAYGLACLWGYLRTGGAGWLVFACIMGVALMLCAASFICAKKHRMRAGVILSALSLELIFVGSACGIDCLCISADIKSGFGTASFIYDAFLVVLTVVLAVRLTAFAYRYVKEEFSGHRNNSQGRQAE